MMTQARPCSTTWAIMTEDTMNIDKIVKSLDSAGKAARLVNATLKGRLPEHLANKEIARAKAKLTRKLWL